MKKVIAILETFWGWRMNTPTAGRTAPRFFRINKQNFTGGRLYKLIGPNANLMCTEACKELVARPTDHGTPDPEWLKCNLQYLLKIGFKPDVILVCGKVAQATYRKTGLDIKAKVLEIPHPAARNVWTKQTIQDVQRMIQA